MSASAIDDLITQFQGDDKPYVAATNRVLAATNRVQHAISHVGTDLFSRFNETFKFTEALAPLAALASAAGLIEMGKHAWEVASAFDVIERKLIGITGSLTRAQQIMKFAEHESSSTGLFSPEVLDNAALKLEAARLQTEKWIPVAEEFAAVFGDGADSVDKFVEAFISIQDGKVGRAVMLLTRAGVSIDEMKSAGVKFHGTNPTSSPQQLLGAISRIGGKFSGVEAQMINSPEAKARAMSNAFDQAFRQIGTSLQSALLPYMSELAAHISEWAEGGQIKAVTDAFLSLFGLGGDSSNFKAFLDHVGDWLREAPAKIAQIKHAFAGMFSALIVSLRVLADIWVGMWAFNTVIAGWTAVTKAIQAASAAEGALAAIQAFVTSMVPGGLALVATAALAATGAVLLVNHLLGDAEKKIKGFFSADVDENSKGSLAGSLVGGALANAQEANALRAVNGGQNSVEGQQLEQLRQINANTKAAAIDLRAYALGGSGQAGVSAIEVQAVRRGGYGRGIRGMADALADTVAQYVDEQISRNQGQALRQGYAR